MDSRFYAKAQHEGLKAYNAAINSHEDPYLPVLEERLPALNQMNRLSLGIQSVPLRRVVGSVSRGRSYAFARNFMPILEASSEFATKWGTLYASVEQEGLRDPAKMLEYMGYYYLIEGNKRVSVMKSLDAEYIEADVTRVIPARSEDPETVAYFEYCAFAKETGIYDLFFSRPGDYARLCTQPGIKSGDQWTEDGILTLRKLWHYFYTAYHTVIQEKKARPSGDAFLLWLSAFGFPNVRDYTFDQTISAVRLMQQDFLLRPEAVSLVMDPQSKDPAPSLISALFRPSKVKAAFLYTRSTAESAWNYWHDLGRLEVQEKLGEKVETTGVVVPSRSETESAIERLIREKYTVIFATSPLMLNSCIEPSLHHPEVKLLVSSQLAGYHRVRTYYLRFYEAKFLLGMAAGMLSGNGKIGYIADYPIYGSPSMINAFAIGARMVNPDATVYLNWTTLADFDAEEPFHDPEIRVICNRDLTAPNHDSRDSGLYVRSEDGTLSMATLIPRWGLFYRHVIEQVYKGTFDVAGSGSAPLSYWWGLGSDALDVTFSGRFDPYGIRLIRNLQSQLRENTFTPFEGQLLDQQGNVRCGADRRLTPAEVLCMDYLADNVVGSVPPPAELAESARPLVQSQGINSPQMADVSSISWNQKG